MFLYPGFPKRLRVAHMFNHGWWRLAVGGWRLAVGGDWRLAVGDWRLVAVGGGWGRLVVRDWWLVAVGSGWRLAVGRRWRWAAVGGWWQLVVGGWWSLGAVLKDGPQQNKNKKESRSQRTALMFSNDLQLICPAQRTAEAPPLNRPLEPRLAEAIRSADRKVVKHVAKGTLFLVCRKRRAPRSAGGRAGRSTGTCAQVRVVTNQLVPWAHTP